MDIDYMYETETWQGFVQQIVYLLGRGYFWYCITLLPQKKKHKWRLIDEKLIRKYGTNLDKFKRSRRKSKGMMNFHYVRWESLAIIFHSSGSEDPDVQMDDKFKDARTKPLLIPVSGLVALRVYQYGGRWTVCLARETFQGHKAELAELVKTKNVSLMVETFNRLNGYPSWAGIVNQRHSLARYLCRQARHYQVSLSTSQFRFVDKRTPVKVWRARNPD